jgi:chorismate mutase/prephenate dehydratase
MAKAKASEKPPVPKKTAAPRSANEGVIQVKIDRIDLSLAKLLQERAALALKAGELANVSARSSVFFAHEEETLARLAAETEGPLPKECVRGIFRELLSGCRALVKATKVAFLGPIYSYSHLAAVHRFGQSVEYVPVGNIAAVFEEVNRGHTDYGLVPIENSTDGRVTDTLDMFTRIPVRICSEVELQIHHTLLARCARTEIQEVYSKPQALSQCRNWLAKHLPSARTIEVTSTTTAAQLAREKPGAAAIASIQAGIHYGLEILAERIEDNPGNTTRFVVIGNESAPRTGHDKMALLFQAEHRPGSLAEAMNIFKRNRLNLTWIESFPIPEMSRVYLFFVELEGHETDPRVRRALAILQRKTLRMEILGSYPAAGPVD